MSFFGDKAWLCELTTHFPLQYMMVLCVCLPFLWMNKDRYSLLVASLLIIINILPVLQVYRKRPHTGIVKESLSCLFLNLNFRNQSFDRAIEYIKKVDADVVVLQELGYDWEKHLKPALQPYLHKVYYPKVRYFGIAVLSKIQGTRLYVMDEPELLYPAILAHIPLADTAINLYATHAIAPETPGQLNARNQHLRDTRAIQDSVGGPFMLIGDLNITPYSPYYKILTEELGLFDSRDGIGIHGSWPTWGGPFRIPLDHCMVDKDIKILKRAIGKNVGSDHHPLYVEIGI